MRLPEVNEGLGGNAPLRARKTHNVEKIGRIVLGGIQSDVKMLFDAPKGSVFKNNR
jgi:hypothetical protein